MPRIKYQEAIGLEITRGRPTICVPPAKEMLVRLYVHDGKSIRETATLLGIKKDMVARALKTYGIVARPRARRSALLAYSLSELEAGIKEKGLRGYARERGVDPGTVHHHLKTRKKKRVESVSHK